MCVKRLLHNLSAAQQKQKKKRPKRTKNIGGKLENDLSRSGGRVWPCLHVSLLFFIFSLAARAWVSLLGGCGHYFVFNKTMLSTPPLPKCSCRRHYPHSLVKNLAESGMPPHMPRALRKVSH